MVKRWLINWYLLGGFQHVLFSSRFVGMMMESGGPFFLYSPEENCSNCLAFLGMV